MPRKMKASSIPVPPPEPLPFFAVEMTQRAEDGGNPLPNEAGFGHGTPVLVVKLREFVAWLKNVNNAAAYTEATVSQGNSFPSKERPEWVEVHGGRANSSFHFMMELYQQTRRMLKRWDNFVVPVSSDDANETHTWAKWEMPLRATLVKAYRQLVHSEECRWREPVGCTCAIADIEKVLGLARPRKTDWGLKLNVTGLPEERTYYAPPTR